jgi:3-hydroxyacyl-CoA dehydrogenase/enoyl-CoA hydratase/carnithine racemase
MPESSPIVTIRYPQNDIAVICMDTPDRPANVLDDQLFSELDDAIDLISAREDLAGVVLVSAKPKIFVAGADLNQIQRTADWPDEKVIEFCEKGRAVMRKFSQANFPSVAAIHGAAVGGGLEIAMWCDYRIATDHRSTQLGLPEVKLGLVPGWAGTVRLPRLTNFSDALKLTALGSLINASKAEELGLIEHSIPCRDPNTAETDLISAAIELLKSSAKENWIQRREQLAGPTQSCGDVESIVAETAKQIVANRDVYLYAPTVVLEHMSRTVNLTAAEAEASESIAMAQVYGSPANRGLLHHYFMIRRNRKQPGLVDTSIETAPIQSVGIIGAGVMGASIATRCVANGIEVRLLDANPGAAARAVDRIKTENDEANICTITDYTELTGVDLVIESVVETAKVKKSVLQKIVASPNNPDWIATNTSAIQIGSLSDAVPKPESFCGIHFCHPKLMSLVEVVCGPKTDEQTIARSVAFVRQLRMMPVAINDCPGFVVNRLLAAMINESIKLYSDGQSIVSIDAAMRDFGFLGGPFEIIDVIGADTCMYAGRSMWEDGLKCISLSPILPRMVKKNLLGRKVGKGFYRYETPDSAEGETIFDSDVDELLASYRNPEPTESLDADEIILRILNAMANEAALIEDEEIVAETSDIDLCVIHGLSFPAHEGGIAFWKSRQKENAS